MWITTVKKIFKFLPFDYDKAELLLFFITIHFQIYFHEVSKA